MLEIAVPAVFNYWWRQWKYYTSLHLLLPFSSSWKFFPAQIVTEPKKHAHTWETLSRTGTYWSLGSSSYSAYSPHLPLTQKGTWIPYNFASSAEPTSILNQFTPLLGCNRLIIVVTSPATVTGVTVIIVVTSPWDAEPYFLLFSHHTFHRNFFCFETWWQCAVCYWKSQIFLFSACWLAIVWAAGAKRIYAITSASILQDVTSYSKNTM